MENYSRRVRKSTNKKILALLNCLISCSKFPVLPRDQLMELEEVAEQDILRSELWTTLFRGGYMIGKLQRSLSGRYVSYPFTF